MEEFAGNRNTKPLTREISGTSGAALVGALVVAMVVSLLGSVSFRLASQEVESIKATRDDAVAKHLAEAGIDLAIQLFHDPRLGSSDPARALFEKRFDLPDEGPSFFDAAGRSQFRGTASVPDLLLDTANPAHDRLLNDPAVGWFHALRGLGRILRFKVYGPTHPGLLCTAEVTVIGMNGLKRTITVQFGTRRIPAIRAGVQVAGNGFDPVDTRGIPLWVHWGDVRIRGDVRMPKIEELPSKTDLATVSALSYGDMSRREDRWLNIYVGGTATFVPSAISPPPPVPSHLHMRQEPFPGLKEDLWKYEEMKKHAMAYGEVYVRERDGLLYRHGRIEPGLGVTLDSLMHSEMVGDHRGVVFVDTLDQQPPRADNLGTLSVEPDYAEGVFIINANLRVKPRGGGRAVTVLSPPSETMATGSRLPVDLQGIHFSGVLSVAGELRFEGRPRLFGALMTGGSVIADGTGSGPLELWTDFELRFGLVRGIPLVFVAPGTWREI